MTDTEIGVECTSIDEWIKAGDQAHIVLMGDPARLKFDYKITGLEEAEKYSIELVFTPDLTYRFTRSYKSDGSWDFFCKKEDPPADAEKFTGIYTHKQGFQTGEAWMKNTVEFNSIVFRTTLEGTRKKNREQRFRRSERTKNELYLEGRFKYQVAVRIKKEGVEEAVYEKDVPGQTFISCGQRSEHEQYELDERKRKSEGGKEVQKKKPKGPHSSGDNASNPGPSNAPEDQASSSQDATHFRLPRFGQVPPADAVQVLVNQLPPPYQELQGPSNRPPALAPPPVEDAPAVDAQEAPMPRPQIGSGQCSAFRRYSRNP